MQNNDRVSGLNSDSVKFFHSLLVLDQEGFAGGVIASLGGILETCNRILNLLFSSVIGVKQTVGKVDVATEILVDLEQLRADIRLDHICRFAKLCIFC